MNMRTENKDRTNISLESNYLQNSPVGIKIIKLNKFFGNNHVLNDLDLEIFPSETLVIIGKSGTGKSVLLRHIIGLEKPDSGKIYINGKDVNDPNFRMKHRLAMVFQSSALFNSLTVAENVALYLKEHAVFEVDSSIKKVVSDTLSIVGLEGKEDVMSPQLSGGMRKRVAIARALAMNPDLILFDEPTSELDPMIARTISDVILNLRKHVEVTQIIVTHDIDLAFYIADRIAVLDEGQILEVGTPKEISRSNNSLIKDFTATHLEREEGGTQV